MAWKPAVWLHILLFSLKQNVFCELSGGMLYPKASESRQIQELNGMWAFRADMSPNRMDGFEHRWFATKLAKTGPVIEMPVPSSYNDITTDKALRDFVGWVWYEREFYVPSDWQSDRRVVLRIDSAHYYAIVWVNGQKVMEHNGGHLPFEAQVNDQLDFGGRSRITVAVNNTLTPHTLPPGTLTYHTNNPRYPPGYFVQNLQFDFFNYAGIHRQVRLYTTPHVYVDDISIVTDLQGTAGKVGYKISRGGSGASTVKVEIVDREDNHVAESQTMSGELNIPNAHLWWPYTMNATHFGYRYTLKVSLRSGDVTDVYRQHFGVRTVRVTDTQLLINNRPFYCHGAAKHEDSDIRGKGLDFALIARDFNMLKWLGVNCFRTSHYPYAEEILEQADRQGIAVIDESPGVGIQSDENFSSESLAHHLEVMEEMVRRDKNKPSVIIWSVANEPRSDKTIAEAYFKSVILHTRELDGTRPVTFVSASEYSNDKAAQFTDIQCINRYYGWYEDTGHLETIPYQLSYDLQHWYDTIHKPLIITEYGADTVAGLHTVPSFIFTEDYQVQFMEHYHQVFDVFRKKFLVGEMVWNFADFMTDQQVNRVVGNRKGVLTRQRQPKAAAHLLRRRYWAMIQGNSTMATTDKHCPPGGSVSTFDQL